MAPSCRPFLSTIYLSERIVLCDVPFYPEYGGINFLQNFWYLYAKLQDVTTYEIVSLDSHIFYTK
jgi:hypothetical protein